MVGLGIIVSSSSTIQSVDSHVKCSSPPSLDISWSSNSKIAIGNGTPATPSISTRPLFANTSPREGENIAFEVVEVCTEANHHLNIWRARFSALIDRVSMKQCSLVQPNKLFADAVDARQEIDLRIGASLTRFQTMLLRDAFVIDFATDDRILILSYGPCQFPTLGFVVERYWEIQSHEPEEFWTTNCTHNSGEGTSTFHWMRGHVFDYTCAVILYEMCVQEPTATENYLDVYRFESWGGSMIPVYTFGQQFIPTTLTMDSGVTRPPPLLSEADLLNCMDKAGIGTDATMHDHIKKLLDRFYATKDSNTRFLPTNLDGYFMVGCLGYPQCRNVVWLPGSISEAVVITNVCNTCAPGPVFMIQFKFRRLEIPPNFSVDHLDGRTILTIVMEEEEVLHVQI